MRKKPESFLQLEYWCLHYFLQPVFAFTNNGEVKGEVKFDSVENYGNEGDAVPGELIVTIEGEQTSQTRHVNRGQAVKEHIESFKEQGLVVKGFCHTRKKQ